MAKKGHVKSHEWRAKLSASLKGRPFYGKHWNDGRLLESRRPEFRDVPAKRLHLAHRLAHYGLSLAEYDQMILASEGRCSICNNVRELQVDHCHQTGLVRGLLCQNCNGWVLPWFDDRSKLARVMSYLGMPAIAGGASRSHEGNLGKQLTKDQIEQPGGVMVADHLRVEAELREIYKKISHADPLASSVQQDGNFEGNMVQVTTPSSADAEVNVAHNLGKVPVAWQVVIPAKSGYRVVGSLYNIRDADATYLYLAVSQAADTNRALALRVW